MSKLHLANCRRLLTMVILIGLNLSCSNKSENNKSKAKKTAGIAITTWDADMIVNNVVFKSLKDQKSAIDAVEAGAINIENDINCCVGLGGNPDRDGRVTLDACIMDHLFNCGSVAYLQKIKNPISLARKVMENTPHVFLVGDGAERYAKSVGMELIEPTLSKDAETEYKKWLIKSEYKPQINIETQQSKGSAPPKKLSNGDFNHDTMGLLAIDKNNNIAGACTTSGMGFKMAGRLGDSPIIGSGLYVDNEVGGAVASGQGEEVIRICGTHLVVEFMRQGMTPTEACKKAVDRIIKVNPSKAKDFQVGFIAINKAGDHGSFAIHPGFTYAVQDVDGLKKVVKSQSVFKD
jgi:N4-(beta-N-acetylglucosaminyl)-L-asparaginase